VVLIKTSREVTEIDKEGTLILATSASTDEAINLGIQTTWHLKWSIHSPGDPAQLLSAWHVLRYPPYARDICLTHGLLLCI